MRFLVTAPCKIPTVYNMRYLIGRAVSRCCRENIANKSKHFVTSCNVPPCDINACAQMRQVGVYVTTLSDGADFRWAHC